MNTELLLKNHPVIPVVSAVSEEAVRNLFPIFLSEDFTVIELTLRAEGAMVALSFAAEEYPEATIGAGTVLFPEQAEQAIQRGAKFIVSPGFSEKIAEICQKNGIPYIPGCVTPTEITAALSHGLNVIKFFPADIYGGVNALRALSAPFPQVKFMPTGGIDEENLKEYLSFERVSAVGGSFLGKGNVKEKCARLHAFLKKEGKMQ